MPVYEYECAACGHHFEEWQKITDKPVKSCPACRARKVERLISLTSFHLKGGGWYGDLYASKKPAGDSAADKAGKSGSASDGSPASAGSDGGKTPSGDAAASGSSGDKAADKSGDKSGDKKGGGASGAKSDAKTDSKSDGKKSRGTKARLAA